MTLDHLTREYSHRLGVLTAEQLQAALHRFDLGRLLDARPAGGGIFGQNLFLISTAGEFVLRGKPHYDWQFPAEMYFSGLIHEKTPVPVPWPYLVDESTDVFGWPYVIMPKMPGKALADFGARDELSIADAIEISKAMGRELAKLHGVTMPRCGEFALSLGQIEPIGGTYGEWTEERVMTRIGRCLEEGVLTSQDASWCRDVVRANAVALDVPFTPVLVHHDYKRGNVSVEYDHTGWHVTGVFDLMECYAGDGEEDLVRSVFDLGVDDGRARAFVQAYQASRPLRGGYRQRFGIHALRDALLIWGFEHRRGRYVARGRTFREWAEIFVYFDPFTGARS